MPVNVAMKEPWARIIRLEPERHVVRVRTNANCVSSDRIDVIIRGTARDADDIECVAVQMERMLLRYEVISMYQRPWMGECSHFLRLVSRSR